MQNGFLKILKETHDSTRELYLNKADGFKMIGFCNTADFLCNVPTETIQKISNNEFIVGYVENICGFWKLYLSNYCKPKSIYAKPINDAYDAYDAYDILIDRILNDNKDNKIYS